MPPIYQDKQCRQRSERKFHSNASSEQLDRQQSAEAVPLFGTRVRLGLVRLDMGFIAKSGFRPRLRGGRSGFELEMMVLGFAGLGLLGYLERRPAILSAHGLAITAEIGSDWLARSLRRLLRSGEERAFDQRRLTSQPRDLTVCRFRLRGRRFSGNVVALLTSRAALLPRAAQGAFCE